MHPHLRVQTFGAHDPGWSVGPPLRCARATYAQVRRRSGIRRLTRGAQVTCAASAAETYNDKIGGSRAWCALSSLSGLSLLESDLGARRRRRRRSPQRRRCSSLVGRVPRRRHHRRGGRSGRAGAKGGATLRGAGTSHAAERRGRQLGNFRRQLGSLLETDQYRLSLVCYH